MRPAPNARIYLEQDPHGHALHRLGVQVVVIDLRDMVFGTSGLDMPIALSVMEATRRICSLCLARLFKRISS